MNINKHLRTNQSGFTLIELVVVIVILGILSITALPKFINIQSDANAVVIKAAIGSMKSAVSLFKVKTIVSGVTFETDVEFSGIKAVVINLGQQLLQQQGFQLIIHHLPKYLKARV